MEPSPAARRAGRQRSRSCTSALRLASRTSNVSPRGRCFIVILAARDALFRQKVRLLAAAAGAGGLRDAATPGRTGATPGNPQDRRLQLRTGFRLRSVLRRSRRGLLAGRQLRAAPRCRSGTASLYRGERPTDPRQGVLLRGAPWRRALVAVALALGIRPAIPHRLFRSVRVRAGYSPPSSVAFTVGRNLSSHFVNG